MARHRASGGGSSNAYNPKRSGAANLQSKNGQSGSSADSRGYPPSKGSGHRDDPKAQVERRSKTFPLDGNSFSELQDDSSCSLELTDAEKAKLYEECEAIDAVLTGVEQDALKRDLKDEDRQKVWGSVRGRVYKLSFHSQGCRMVQRAIDLLDSPHQVELVKELKDKVDEALNDPHGNHVLQKLIEAMPPNTLQFILDELKNQSSAKLAKHKYGCRVLERLLEHFFPNDIEPFFKGVIDDSKDLSMDPFGNFVIGHVLEHGTKEQKSSIIDMIKSNLQDLVPKQKQSEGNAAYSVLSKQNQSKQTEGNAACSVLGKALSYAEPKDQLEIAQAIVDTKGLLVEMACLRGGHGGFEATLRLLKVLRKDSTHHVEALRQLLHQDNMPQMQQTKNGKYILHECNPQAYPDPDPDPDVQQVRQTKTTSHSWQAEMPATRQVARPANRRGTW